MGIGAKEHFSGQQDLLGHNLVTDTFPYTAYMSAICFGEIFDCKMVIGKFLPGAWRRVIYKKSDTGTIKKL
jgi:hypothetical protein